MDERKTQRRTTRRSQKQLASSNLVALKDKKARRRRRCNDAGLRQRVEEQGVRAVAQQNEATRRTRTRPTRPRRRRRHPPPPHHRRRRGRTYRQGLARPEALHVHRHRQTHGRQQARRAQSISRRVERRASAPTTLTRPSGPSRRVPHAALFGDEWPRAASRPKGGVVGKLGRRLMKTDATRRSWRPRRRCPGLLSTARPRSCVQTVPEADRACADMGAGDARGPPQEAGARGRCEGESRPATAGQGDYEGSAFECCTIRHPTGPRRN